MTAELHLPLILLAGLMAAGSPGPATLTIAGTAMAEGRHSGLAVASGITLGSLVWSVAAALGLSAVMLAHAWMFEAARYLGTAYLAYLAYKSAKSALSRKAVEPRFFRGSRRALVSKGLALHLTNPKAVLFFGSLYSIGVPADATTGQLALVICALAIQNCLLFHGYALIFSTPGMTRRYLSARRWFEGAFALGFGAASVKIATARLQ
ncbi:MAG: LysE family translocator [Rhodospirillaceae bacterium]|nr:LysE family translocator [Rhodospirillaceae bacterium]